MAAKTAEPPPVPNFGAADLRPTPEQPIGFQADGNGWYPGDASDGLPAFTRIPLTERKNK